MSRLRSDRLGLGISGRHLVLAAARRGSASPWRVARALADDAASPAGVAQLPGLLAEMFDALAQQVAASAAGSVSTNPRGSAAQTKARSLRQSAGICHSSADAE